MVAVTGRPTEERLIELLITQIQELRKEVREGTQRIHDRIDESVERFEKQFVSRVEFEARIEPLRKLVYSAVGVVLLGFMGGLVALVWRASA